jgi:prepilin-type N-terminal cleavage/methylation domain-containing protein
MQNQTVPYKQRQTGFTLVEVVAVMVITTILAAYAIPRMLGPGEFAAKVTADRVLAALQYAQVLAQRQGVATSVVIVAAPPGFAVRQLAATPPSCITPPGCTVTFTTQNYDGTDTGGLYNVKLHPDVTISGGTITYGANGIPTVGAGTYSINDVGMSFTIKVESTGFAHFV